MCTHVHVKYWNCDTVWTDIHFKNCSIIFLTKFKMLLLFNFESQVILLKMMNMIYLLFPCSNINFQSLFIIRFTRNRESDIWYKYKMSNTQCLTLVKLQGNQEIVQREETDRKRGKHTIGFEPYMDTCLFRARSCNTRS